MVRHMSETDWQTVLAIARRHALAPLLFHALRSMDVPQGARETLRQAYYATAARNLRLYRRLGELLAAFAAAGHEVLLLKGAYLAEFAYGNPALRPMADLDLLARPQVVPALLETLASQGYVAISSAWGASLRHAVPYRGPDGTLIEIHDRLFETVAASGEETDALWARAIAVSLPEFAARALCPEDALVHLAMHTAMQHGFDNGLLPFLDARQIVERHGAAMDWPALRTRSEAWGAARAVRLVLRLADRYFGLTLPQETFALFPPCPEEMAAAERLVVRAYGENTGVTEDLARLFGERGLRARIRLLRQRLVPPSRSGTPPVARTIAMRRSLARAGRLTGKYGRTALAALLGKRDVRAALHAEQERNRLRTWLTTPGEEW